MRHRSLVALLLSVAAAIGCDARMPASPPPAVIETPALTGEVPWTGTMPLRDGSDFDFVVVADRTVGHRDGVFEQEMPRKVNLLRPEFVISVGDLIEGYTEDRAQLAREWDELEAAIGRLGMPFFYVPGNHDLRITSRPGASFLPWADARAAARQPARERSRAAPLRRRAPRPA